MTDRIVNYGSQYLNSRINTGGLSGLPDVNLADNSPQAWTILDETGEQAFSFDVFEKSNYKGESKIVQSPVEEGSFASYNMTLTPQEVGCTLIKRGRSDDLSAFINALQAFVESTDLLTVVTPEREYQNMKLTKATFDRSIDNGTDCIVADLSFQEVREITSEYTTVEMQERTQRGVQQSKSSASSGASEKPKEKSVLAGARDLFSKRK